MRAGGRTGGHEQSWVAQLVYIIKELVQPKMSLNREFLIWKERGRGERERSGKGYEREGCEGVRERRVGG